MEDVEGSPAVTKPGFAMSSHGSSSSSIRNNSTSTMNVNDTMSRPMNDVISMAVAMEAHKWIVEALAKEDGQQSDESKRVKMGGVTENTPPQAGIVGGNQQLPPNDQELKKYWMMIFKTAQCSVDCLVVSYIYLERLQKSTGLSLSVRNWKSLVAISMLLASKVNDDLSMVNADFAVFLPFTVEQINKWERQFLAGINYDVRFSAGQYAKIYFDLREKGLRAMGIVNNGKSHTVDTERATQLELLSVNVQKRFEEMRKESVNKQSARRAVSDQYCPNADAELPSAPSVGQGMAQARGSRVGGQFVID